MRLPSMRQMPRISGGTSCALGLSSEPRSRGAGIRARAAHWNTRFRWAGSRVGIIPVALLGVILGALCEGSIVGSLQWMVLRRPLPEMRWREWSVATAVGAGIAWALGILTGEIMSSIFAQSSAEADQQVGIGLPMVLLLAAGMGIALGALLWRGAVDSAAKSCPSCWLVDSSQRCSLGHRHGAGLRRNEFYPG